MNHPKTLAERMKAYKARRDALIEQEKQEIVSNCCGAKCYSPDDESFTCLDCHEPCSVIDLNKPEDE